MNELLIVFSILFFIFALAFFFFIFTKSNVNKNPSLDTSRVNQESFQKYAKFYGDYYPTDDRFDIKLYRVYSFIVDKHMTDIKKISEMSLCSLPGTIVMIKYLKNKRYIGDYYIDTINNILLPCTEEDQALLEKYSPFIYGAHIQIDDMITRMPGVCGKNMHEVRKQIFEDLKYLNSKNLLNGIKFDEIDGSIIYYTVEKRKTYRNVETVHCPNCGALNDVDINEKSRCGYCSTIIVGRNYNR